MYSLHAIKWKLCCSNLNVSFLKLWIKNEKNIYVACLLVTSQEIDNLKLKKTTISLFIFHVYFNIRHKCIITINVSPKIS